TLPKAPVGFAPIAIGLTLTFIHLVAIPVDNASVNPARSTATAIFGGGAALGSLWLFWVAPIVGGVIGGLIARWLQEEKARAAKRRPKILHQCAESAPVGKSAALAVCASAFP